MSFWKPAGRFEWPTLVMLAAVYAAFAVATTLVAQWSMPVAVGLLAVVIAQFSSLQHEVLHGHPFRSQRVNEALVFPGLTLFVPFERFRDLHLAHHHDEVLTDPYDDPESNFQDPRVWAAMSGVRRLVLRANNTLLGRMVVGPLLTIEHMTLVDARLAWASDLAGDGAVRRAWIRHGFGVAMVLAWLWLFGAMPVLMYVLAAYLALSLLKIRTFLEHQAHERASGRTVVIEDRGPLALLFLNNNFHVVHHMHPSVAWYDLPGLYTLNRTRYLTRNGGYRYASYAEVFRRHFLRAKDPVPHPIWQPKGQAPDVRQG